LKIGDSAMDFVRRTNYTNS